MSIDPPRRICIVTGTRAEYGLLQWLMRDVRDHDELALQVVATGAHLEEEFGHTVDLIEADGIEVHERVPIELPARDENRAYLRTKKNKMGHLLESV